MGSISNIDREKIISAQKGNQQAIEFIIAEIHRPIYSYIYRMVNNREDAEDLTQDTFIKIFRHIDRYDVERNFSTWVFTIASRTVFDWLRKKRVHKVLNIIDDPDNPFETSVVDKTYKRIEGKFDVDNALKQLDPKYRSVVLLFYWKQFSYIEISNSLKIPVNTVKTYLNRAKVKLKKLL